jgi:hypothetical protein
LKGYLAEMMSPIKKKELIISRDPIKIRKGFDEDDVFALSQNMQGRYETIGDWKGRIETFSSQFSPEEISALYSVVFKYAADFNPNNKDCSINESDLMTSGIMQHLPRCDLIELHTRIRSVVRWIQTRTQMKILGALSFCESLISVSNDPAEHLYKLMSAFKRVEYYWNKKEAKEKLVKEKSEKTSDAISSTISETRGCSWAQFLIVISLFCTNQSNKIPAAAFHIKDERINTPMLSGPDDISTALSVRSQEGRSVSNFSLNSGSSSRLRAFSHSNQIQRKNWLVEMSKSKFIKSFEEFPMDENKKSLLDIAK